MTHKPSKAKINSRNCLVDARNMMTSLQFSVKLSQRLKKLIKQPRIHRRQEITKCSYPDVNQHMIPIWLSDSYLASFAAIEKQHDCQRTRMKHPPDNGRGATRGTFPNLWSCQFFLKTDADWQRAIDFRRKEKQHERKTNISLGQVQGFRLSRRILGGRKGLSDSLPPMMYSIWGELYKLKDAMQWSKQLASRTSDDLTSTVFFITDMVVFKKARGADISELIGSVLLIANVNSWSYLTEATLPDNNSTERLS